jgi:hypothetical protein
MIELGICHRPIVEIDRDRVRRGLCLLANHTLEISVSIELYHHRLAVHRFRIEISHQCFLTRRSPSTDASVRFFRLQNSMPCENRQLIIVITAADR